MLKTESVTRPVRVLDIVPGPPPAILTYERFPLEGGGEKFFTQKVPILDDALYERLRREVAAGDDVEITVVTEWPKPGSPMYLASFARLQLPAQRREA